MECTQFFLEACFFLGRGGGGLPPGERVNAEHHIDAEHLKRERSVGISLASVGWLTDLEDMASVLSPRKASSTLMSPPNPVRCQGLHVKTKEPHKETAGEGGLKLFPLRS